MESSANTLLIVEDSHVQAKIIRTQFAVLTDFSLLTAYSMDEAHKLVQEHAQSIFAAVVDLNLPDAPDGEIVDMVRGYGIPSVVLTASFDDVVRKKFIDARVADYFFKGSIDDIEPLVASVKRLHANRRVKALVVDDSLTLRAIIRRMLEVQCIACVEAKDGIEALELLAADPSIQLVITDFQMPRMDGIELVREIRGKYKINRMAIVGVSSAGSGPLTARFLKNGANDFITKPFETEEFHWRVNQNLNILDAMDELGKYRKGQQ